MPRTIDTRPALWDVLSVILPTSEQTLFLRACLLSGDTARRAWEQWQAQTGGLQRYLTNGDSSVKGLLPLLSSSLRRNEAVLEPGIVPLLNNAYLREQLRYEHYRKILAGALATLAGGGVSAIVLKGAALAETVYPEPAVRHCHDIDLWVEPRDLSVAMNLLVSSGFQPLPGGGKRAMPYALLRHTSGLPLGLYTHLLQIPSDAPGHGGREQEIWSYAQRHNFGGAEASVLLSAVNLLQVLGHASYSASRRSLRWACDALFLIGGKAGLDWNLFSDLAARSNLALPLAVMLSYLEQALSASIPLAVLERLKAAATRTGTLGYEIALGGAHRTANGKLKNLMSKSKGLRERMIILKWILFPSAPYLKMMQEVHHPLFLPLYYPLRPLRYLARLYGVNKQNARVENV